MEQHGRRQRNQYATDRRFRKSGVATFTNQAAGTYNIVNNSGITRGTAAASSFTTPGTFVKFGRRGKSIVGVNFVNTGAVEVQSGALDISGAFERNRHVDDRCRQDAELGGPVASGSTINFAGSTGTLQIDGVTGFSGAVTGFGADDVIDLAGQSVKSLNYAGTQVTVTLVGGATDTFSLSTACNRAESHLRWGRGHGNRRRRQPVRADDRQRTVGVAFSSGANTVTATSATLNAGNSLTGGTGVDTLTLRGGGTFNLASLAAFSFDSVMLATGKDPALLGKRPRPRRRADV